MMKLKNKFNHGEKVHLITDKEGNEYFIISIQILPGGVLLYLLSGTNFERWFYEFEISKDRVNF